MSASWCEIPAVKFVRLFANHMIEPCQCAHDGFDGMGADIHTALGAQRRLGYAGWLDAISFVVVNALDFEFRKGIHGVPRYYGVWAWTHTPVASVNKKQYILLDSWINTVFRP